MKQSHTTPSHQVHPDSDNRQTSAETSTEDINETLTPFKAVASSWVALLPNWTHYRIVLVLCSSGLLMVPVATKLLPSPANLPQPSAQHQIVSRTDYELLKLGMTLTDAQATLGRAVEVSRDATTATYKWSNNDGSEITAVFKDNRLVSKEQSGLR
jgi:hypothetical protein